MSGSTCPIEVVNNVVNKLKAKNIVVIYGLTETSPVITLNSIHDSLENRTQTIGKALEHIEVKVVDKNENIVKVDESGELYVRGYNTMIGYWDEKEKTEQSYTHDRFFKTG
jgi:fatty-acyl-CoA synthase